MIVSVLLEEVAGPQRPFDVELDVELAGAGPGAHLPPQSRAFSTASATSSRTRSISPRERVRIDARWDAGRVEVSIRDDGPGFPDRDPAPPGRALRHDARGRRPGEIGDGFGNGPGAVHRQDPPGALRRVAGAVARAPGTTGAIATVTWPRPAFERGAERKPAMQEFGIRLNFASSVNQRRTVGRKALEVRRCWTMYPPRRPVATASSRDQSLLIVDDDRPFLTRLARAMEGARLCRQHRRNGAGRHRRDPARRRRPSPSSTCGSATAAASTCWPS